jgi:hypothetical protein
LIGLFYQKISFNDECEFIAKKWSEKEVIKFSILVFDFIETIRNEPTIGIYFKEYNYYSIVISKQTTLFYRVLENKKQIDLLLFWNNSQNPTNLLSKLLQK